MDSNGLSGKDICAIIKACSETHVKDLEFGDLRVSFRQRTDEIADEVPIIANNPEELQKMREIAEREERELRLLRQEQDELEMQIMDPERFEDALVSGEM